MHTCNNFISFRYELSCVQCSTVFSLVKVYIMILYQQVSRETRLSELSQVFKIQDDSVRPGYLHVVS